MKLGKGPISVLDRHSTFNDTTALCLRSNIINFYENMSIVTTRSDDVMMRTLILKNSACMCV